MKIQNVYCLIRVISNDIIALYYFENDRSQLRVEMPICFTARNANSLYQLLCSHKSLAKNISLSHALYLGQELYKAELALVLGQIYVQN